MTYYEFDEGQTPVDYLDSLVASVAKVTETFSKGGMPKALLDLSWEILLNEFRELLRAQQAYHKAFAPQPGNGARPGQRRSEKETVNAAPH